MDKYKKIPQYYRPITVRSIEGLPSSSVEYRKRVGSRLASCDLPAHHHDSLECIAKYMFDMMNKKLHMSDLDSTMSSTYETAVWYVGEVLKTFEDDKDFFWKDEKKPKSASKGEGFFNFSRETPSRRLKRVGLVAIFIALKMESRDEVMTVREMCAFEKADLFGKGPLAKKGFLRAEAQMLQRLRWRLTMTTPIAYFYAAVSEKTDKSIGDEDRWRAEDVLDKCHMSRYHLMYSHHTLGRAAGALVFPHIVSDLTPGEVCALEFLKNVERENLFSNDEHVD